MVRVVSVHASPSSSHSLTPHEARPPAHAPLVVTVRTRFVASKGGRHGMLFVSHWIWFAESEWLKTAISSRYTFAVFFPSLRLPPVLSNTIGPNVRLFSTSADVGLSRPTVIVVLAPSR